MNYSIITYIFNNYEPVREVLCPQDNVEYILVTDNKYLKSSTWKVVYEPLLDTENLSGLAKTFLIKYNAYKYVSNNVYVTMDSQLQLMKSIDWLVEDFDANNYDFLTFQHANNYYIKNEYRDWQIFRNQDKYYFERFYEQTKNLGYNYEWPGLFGGTFHIRRKSVIVNALLNDIIKYVFSDNFQKCDNNDQGYLTVLLQTKYNFIMSTKIISYTLLDSEYIKCYMHGTNEESQYCKALRYNDHEIYWRGELIYVAPSYNNNLEEFNPIWDNQ